MNNIIFYLIHNLAFQYAWLDFLIIFLAEPFIYIVILVITIVLLKRANIFSEGIYIKSIWSKGRSIAIIILSTGLSYIIANLLKLVLKTDRPFMALSDVHTLISETGYAFPSGHSATIAAFAFAVYFRNKKLGSIALVAMVLIGIARVAAGVHFPIDIIGGYALGFVVAFLLKSL